MVDKAMLLLNLILISTANNNSNGPPKFCSYVTYQSLQALGHVGLLLLRQVVPVVLLLVQLLLVQLLLVLLPLLVPPREWW